MKRQPLISIVVLNFNQLEVTIEFLNSTEKLSYRNFEIILVDNASRESPVQVINEKYPYVNLIINDKNLGYAGGNNVGIAASKGDYILIVNNDTEVTENLIENLLLPFNNDPTVGVVSPKIMYFQEPSTIQYAGFTPINPITGRNKCIGNKEVDIGQHNIPGYTAYAHGAAMFVKRTVVDRVGAFDDLYFLYYEELDWSFRIKKAGYQIYYQPSAVIYHKESISVGKDSTLQIYYLTRNRILFMRRNIQGLYKLLWPIFLIFISIPKNSLLLLLQGKLNHLKAFLNALIWNLIHRKNGNAFSFLG